MGFVVSLVLLSLCEVGLLLSIKKSSSSNAFFRLPPTSKLLTYIFLVFTMLFLGFMIIFIINAHKKQPSEPIVLRTTHIASSKYLKLAENPSQNMTNVYFLWKSPDKTKETLASEALLIKQKFCSKQCIIHFYDTRHAYLVDSERIFITKDALMQEWNIKNYLYVANHYLGYLTDRPNPSFSYYPYKDAYYRSRVGK